MKKLIARVKCLFDSPEKDSQEIYEILNELKTGLEEVQCISNKVAAVVELFKVVISFNSTKFYQIIINLENKNYGQLTEQIEVLKALREVIQRTLNSPECYCRPRSSRSYEIAPSDNNVYIGGIYGLPTRTVHFFLRNETELKTRIKLNLSKDPQAPVSEWDCIHDHRAEPFVKNYGQGILSQIDRFMDLS